MRTRSLLALPLLALIAATTTTRPGIPETGQAYRIWPGRAPRAIGDGPAEVPSITCFPPVPGTANGAAVVVCPGGGYSTLVTGKEGVDACRWLAGHGVFAVMLKYRVNVAQPAPMLDGQRAVRTLRYHAKSWGIDPARVGIMGFSAGGHVASTVGTHYDTGIPHTGDPVQDESCRPDFMLLVYPVITMKAGVTHPGSRQVLLGDKPASAVVTLYSNETQVTTDTPPAFIVASKTDKIVPVENSQLFAEALKRRKVPVEYLELPTGNHGYGLAAGDPDLAVWTGSCLDWMNAQGLMTKRLPTTKPGTKRK